MTTTTAMTMKNKTNISPPPTEADDCEWVDDAVLNLSAVCTLCHAHDHAQIEFERSAPLLQTKKPLALLQSQTPSNPLQETIEVTPQSILPTITTTNYNTDEGLETLGMEVQLQSIKTY